MAVIRPRLVPLCAICLLLGAPALAKPVLRYQEALKVGARAYHVDQLRNVSAESLAVLSNHLHQKKRWFEAARRLLHRLEKTNAYKRQKAQLNELYQLVYRTKEAEPARFAYDAQQRTLRWQNAGTSKQLKIKTRTLGDALIAYLDSSVRAEQARHRENALLDGLSGDHPLRGSYGSWYMLTEYLVPRGGFTDAHIDALLKAIEAAR